MIINCQRIRNRNRNGPQLQLFCHVKCSENKFMLQRQQWRKEDCEKEGQIWESWGQISSKVTPEAKHLVGIRAKAPPERQGRRRNSQNLSSLLVSNFAHIFYDFMPCPQTKARTLALSALRSNPNPSLSLTLPFPASTTSFPTIELIHHSHSPSDTSSLFHSRP